ncbi:unnamed protein product [Acanthoscelides obtectus]|uniref:AMP-binding enzyme C-terminal domain-containing protein n=1 Tax=Acanthoscelides obtectus TaxID=200917 RepID=A0A9P0KW61_ACAOB|nr:unnamed protein product [Acanthoscelides obtectus]CAK1674783.1 hypothetical protein AOBTE_LOCUS29740 [Acanthoscelides obtectus]
MITQRIYRKQYFSSHSILEEMVHDNIIRTSEVRLNLQYLGGVGYVLFNNLKKKGDRIITVVDLDTGERLGPNKAGELRVKSRNILNCYYRVPNSDHLDSDGWFKTGDVVKYDEDLCFYFEGRIKDIIVYQGWHVAPGILETKLKSHPAVKRAAVVGKPHPADGEHPLALVELSDGRTDVDLMEIKEFVDEDMNDIYKLRGGIVAVKKLPVTITGKVKKGLLRKMMEGRMVVSATEEVSDSFSQRA